MGTSDRSGSAEAEPVDVRIEHAGLATDVLVSAWLVSDGDLVGHGDPIVVIESEKTEFEVAAPVAGRIEILVPASEDDVAAGTLIARIHP